MSLDGDGFHYTRSRQGWDNARQPDTYTLQKKTLDGASVYALQPTGGSVTYYFNAQTYVLDGSDWMQDGSSWQARLDPTSYHTMPLASLPADTFLAETPDNPNDAWGEWVEGSPSRHHAWFTAGSPLTGYLLTITTTLSATATTALPAVGTP